MGNEQSEVEKVSIDHEYFHNSEVNKKQSKIITKIPIKINEADFKYWKGKVKDLKNSSYTSVLLLPLEVEEKMPAAYCGTTPTMELQFDNNPYLLDDEIQNRSRINAKHFEEEEMWLLLYTLVKAQRPFESRSEKIGDVQPHNIFINEEGYLKVACQYSWPNETTNYEKAFYDKKFGFLAPEEFVECEKGQRDNLCNPAKAEAFSIGLTMLSAGLLESLSQIVNMETFKFNREFLDYALKKWMALEYQSEKYSGTKCYSNSLKRVVCELCRIEPSERLTGWEVFEALQPHEAQILSIQQFVLEDQFLRKYPVKKTDEYLNASSQQSIQTRPFIPASYSGNGSSSYVPPEGNSQIEGSRGESKKPWQNNPYSTGYKNNYTESGVGQPIGQLVEGSISNDRPEARNGYESRLDTTRQLFNKYAALNSNEKKQPNDGKEGRSNSKLEAATSNPGFHKEGFHQYSALSQPTQPVLATQPLQNGEAPKQTPSRTGVQLSSHFEASTSKEKPSGIIEQGSYSKIPLINPIKSEGGYIEIGGPKKQTEASNLQSNAHVSVTGTQAFQNGHADWQKQVPPGNSANAGLAYSENSLVPNYSIPKIEAVDLARDDDLLKKIEEQLENSRKSFPSRPQ